MGPWSSPSSSARIAAAAAGSVTSAGRARTRVVPGISSMSTAPGRPAVPSGSPEIASNEASVPSRTEHHDRGVTRHDPDGVERAAVRELHRSERVLLGGRRRPIARELVEERRVDGGERPSRPSEVQRRAHPHRPPGRSQRTGSCPSGSWSARSYTPTAVPVATYSRSPSRAPGCVVGAPPALDGGRRRRARPGRS